MQIFTYYLAINTACKYFIVSNTCNILQLKKKCFKSTSKNPVCVLYYVQDRTMVHYTGYEAIRDLSVLARQLNMMIRKTAQGSLKTVITKYSHK